MDNILDMQDVLGNLLKNNPVNSDRSGLSGLFKFLHEPKIYFIYSALELLLTIKWLQNPWPFSGNTFEKYPGSMQIFIFIYFTISLLYFFFLRAKTYGGEEIKDISLYFDYVKNVYTTLMVIIGSILFLVGIFWFISYFDFAYYFVKYFLDIVLITVILGIFYLTFERTFKNISKNTGPMSILLLIKDLVFFIPCLLIAFVEYLTQDFAKTSKTSWVLLAVALGIILMQFLLPYIFNKIVSHDGILLLKEPVYLNKETDLAKSKEIHGDKTKANPDPHSYQYSLSAWYYINPQPPNTSAAYSKFTPILNYGNKPLVEYNGSTDTIRVMCDSGKERLTEIASIKNIQYQKWNNIVVNYDGANMDVFINGELAGTQGNIAPYMSYDNVVVGSKNGIHGGICNVVYHDHPLTQSKIKLAYHSLRDMEYPLL